MVIETEVDINLLFLENFLLNLNTFNFTEDISTKISELLDLIDKKLNSVLPSEYYDIVDVRTKQIFYLKK